jgi:conserved hypothetical protein (putative transposase or invertase)
MQEKKVLTTNDLVFKKVFASPQNSHILIGFINDILDIQVDEVTIMDTYNIRSFYDENGNPDLRYTQVDVLAKLKDGSLVGIEMQVYKQLLYRERALFYTAGTYVSNYGKHELMQSNMNYRKMDIDYSALRPVYSICIMMENEFSEDNQPIHMFTLYDRKNQLVYKKVNHHELFNIVFLELKKSSVEMQANIKEWIDYFLQGEVSKGAPEYVQEACKEANYLSLSEEEKGMIDAREKARQDYMAIQSYAWIEGIEKGKAEGIEMGKVEGKAEGKAEIISAMVRNGKSVQEISELISMTKEEVEQFLTKA